MKKHGQLTAVAYLAERLLSLFTATSHVATKTNNKKRLLFLSSKNPTHALRPEQQQLSLAGRHHSVRPGGYRDLSSIN
jgi:primosomal protein N''